MARYLLLRLGEKYGVDVELALQAVGNRGGLERIGNARQFLNQTICAKSGGKDYFESLMAAFEASTRTNTSPCTARTITSA